MYETIVYNLNEIMNSYILAIWKNHTICGPLLVVNGVMIPRVTGVISPWNKCELPPQKTNMKPRKSHLWKGKSSSKPSFLASMLVFGGVSPSYPSQLDPWGIIWYRSHLLREPGFTPLIMGPTDDWFLSPKIASHRTSLVGDDSIAADTPLMDAGRGDGWAVGRLGLGWYGLSIHLHPRNLT